MGSARQLKSEVARTDSLHSICMMTNMKQIMNYTALLLIVQVFAIGCARGATVPAPQETDADPHPHPHEGDDALVWVEKDFEHAGASISLGHHGEHVHAASMLEPSVMIMHEGEPVADAQVFNCLVSADGNAVIDEEVATVYEPESENEPAHYAQGKLHVPKGVVRFRIVLAGESEDLTRDMTVEVE